MKEFKTEIKWGIIILVFRIIWLLLEFFIGVHSSLIGYYNISVTISFAAISFIMILAYREKLIEVKQSGSFFVLFFFGVIVSSIAIILYGLIFYGYISFINKQLPVKIAEEFSVYSSKFAVSKSVLVKQNISKSIFFSMLMSLILSVIFKRKPKSE